MTGRDGLARHLASGEIVAQVALARTRRPVRRVVFMGMGEPAHNLDNVLDAITLLGTGGDLGAQEPGVLDRRRPARVRAPAAGPRQAGARALAAHDRTPSYARSCCRARRASSPRSSSRSADEYSRATDYPTQYQWTLLEGVNDGDDELETLATLLARPLRASSTSSRTTPSTARTSAARRGNERPR